MPKVQMRCFHCAWKEFVSKKCLTLQLMKNSAANADHENPHSLQPVTIDHVENEQLKKKLLHQEEAKHHNYHPNLKLDLKDEKYPSLLDLSLWQDMQVEKTDRVNAHYNCRKNPSYLKMLTHYR